MRKNLKTNRLTKNVLCLLTCVLVIGFISGCGILPEEEEVLAPPLVKPKKEEYELYKAQRKDITKYVKGNGSLVAVQEKPLFFKESGRRLKSIDVKLGQEVKKGQVLGRLDTGDLETQIKLQEYELRKRQIAINQLKEANADKYSMENARIDYSMTKLQLGALKKQRNSSLLISPVKGVVTYIENVKEGDVIEPFKTMVIVSDPRQVHVYYQSNNTNLVKTGMKAQVTYNGKKYEGKVVMSPDTVPADANETMKNAILIDVKGLENANMGDMIEIEIPIESKKDTIVISKRGLRRYMGAASVQVMEGNSKRELDVEVGIETPTEVEIVDGLKEGQMVILK